MSLKILRRSCASRQVLEIVENVPGLVRRQPERFCSQRFADAARRQDDRHCRGVRRHDDRPRLSARLARTSGRWRSCSSVRAGNSTPSWSRNSTSSAAKIKRRLRGEAASRWLRSLASTTVNSYWEFNGDAAPAVEPAVDAMFQGRLLGHHVRRGRVHRRRRAGHAVEPRGGTADGHVGRRHPRPAVASALAGAFRRKRVRRRRGAIAPCTRRSAAACNRCGD